MKAKTLKSNGRRITTPRTVRMPPKRRAIGSEREFERTPALKVKSILVPVDFSEPSKKALRYAVKFAEQFGATLTLLYVTEPVIPPPDGFGVVPFIDLQSVQKSASVKLGQLAEEEIDELIPVKTLVRTGRAYQEIVEMAREQRTDLIIIGTHGYRGLEHIFLGSTAERVVRHAPCPVLTVRELNPGIVS